MICRLCLITIDVDKKVSIFTASGIDGESRIVKLIAKYLHLEVTQHDPISTTLCHECWNHIDEFHKFCIFVDTKQSSLLNEFLEVKCDVRLLEHEDDNDIEQPDEALCNVQDVLQETVEVQLKSEPNEVNIFDETANSDVDHDVDLSDDNKSLQKQNRRCNPKRTAKRPSEVQIKQAKTLQKVKAVKAKKSKKDDIIHEVIKKTRAKKIKLLYKEEPTDDDEDDFEADNKKDEDYEPEDIEEEDEKWLQRTAFMQSDDDDGEQSSAATSYKKRKTKYPSKPKPTETPEEMNNFISQNMQLKCDLCDAHFERFIDVRSHYREQHKRRENIKCCGRTHCRLRDLYEHIKWHFDPEYFKCDECGRLMKSTHSLEMHKITKHVSSQEFLFNCEYCDKRFARSFMLRNHIKIAHEAKRNQVCQHCDKRFIVKNHLLKHIQSMHDNVFPHICDICGMKFKFKPSFETHVLEHQGIIEPPVQCPECGVWTKNKNCLRTHLTTHNKVDVNCKYCGRVCASLSAMRAHVQKMHRRPPSYKCTFCDKLVKTPKDLKEHIATHTGENLYNCPHCTKEFRSSSNMYAHIKRLHTQEWLAAKLERPRKAPNMESRIIDVAYGE